MSDAEIQAQLPASYASVHASLTAEAERIERDKALYEAHKVRYRDIKDSLITLEMLAHDARYGKEVPDNPIAAMAYGAPLNTPATPATSRSH